jgi:hypothetical protein
VVADFFYVGTPAGFAVIVDVFTQRIVAWHAPTDQPTDLVSCDCGLRFVGLFLCRCSFSGWAGVRHRLCMRKKMCWFVARPHTNWLVLQQSAVWRH